MPAPEKKFKAGKVNVAVFRNEGQGGSWRTCTIQVSYKDTKTNSWKNSNSFTSGDACVAKELLSKAIDYMVDADAEERDYGSSNYDKSYSTDEPLGPPVDDDIPF